MCLLGQLSEILDTAFLVLGDEELAKQAHSTVYAPWSYEVLISLAVAGVVHALPRVLGRIVSVSYFGTKHIAYLPIGK